ncbi:MAG: hypothetical protein HY286_06225 [Planctomycetes bacterium]|nr:hypothetical protein [Planctomycetota bacterium]
MGLTFLQLAQRVLDEEKRPLTPDEIWDVAKLRNYDKEVGSKGLTPSHTVAAQLYIQARDNPGSAFCKIGSRPARFGLRSWSKEIINPPSSAPLSVPQAPQFHDFLERDLHSFVVHYGYNYLHAYLKTIQHERSRKDEFGEWVHPDIVGCYFPHFDWDPHVVDVSAILGSSAVKLYSFELKRELSMGNLRESFFQCVSNSSWANEAYLCAARISDNEDFREELERLSESFGIGVLRIDIVDPNSTRVLYAPRRRVTVDWEMVNKLMFNPDFKEFVKRIKNDLQTKEVRKESYDRVLSAEELASSISKKNPDR